MILPAMETPASLIARLRQSADLWVAAHLGGSRAASLAMLGRTVINDGGYFARIETTESTTTATLEKFARYLDDKANWPDGQVPGAVREFVHAVGGTPADGIASPGKADAISQPTVGVNADGQSKVAAA